MKNLVGRPIVHSTMSKIAPIKVSVIVPVRDRLILLLRALKSVESQTFKSFEVLVIDDHSKPSLSALGLPHSVRLLNSEGHGVSAARNTGIREANGEFVAFLDSDDEWLPEKLEKQVAFLDAHPSIPLVHTEEVWMRSGARVNQKQKHRRLGGRVFEKSCELCMISPSTTMVRRSLFEDVGYFDENFPVCEDYDLWLRITARSEVGVLSEALTIKHGGHEDQLSMKYHSMDLWRVRALQKHLNSSFLSDSENAKLRSEIQKKSLVLLAGFEKHGNFEFKAEVEEYLKRARSEN